MSNLYFVGGIFEPSCYKFYINNSAGIVQNAANVYQSNLLKGMDHVFPEGVKVVSLPFIGSYPSRFKKIFLGSKKTKIFNNSLVIRLGFLNLSIVKLFSRFTSLFSFILKEKITSKEAIIIYSMHLPFVAAIVLARFISKRKYKIYIIVPDLPEYMSDRTDFIYLVFKKVDAFLLRFFMSKIDGYILLTKHMASRLNISSDKYIVVEGVSGEVSEAGKDIATEKEKYILYSGTLASRYGVCDLVNAFMAIENKEYKLWICGDGDAKDYIEKASEIDPRIKYLGQLSRDKVISLQVSAALLVNPRRPDGEYTKYSFPSKIIEYMASGRPVLMYRLPGIPDEYFKYCYTPTGLSVTDFQECLYNTLRLTDYELTSKGLDAKKFIDDHKSCVIQAEKIKEFIIRSNQ